MSEKELRAKLGDKKFEELAKLVKNLRAKKVTEEEIMKEVKRQFGNDPALEAYHVASPL